MKITIKSLVLILLLVWNTTKAQNQFSTDEKNELEKFIQKKMKQRKVTGLSVSVLYKNNLIIDKGFGFSDVSKKIPVTRNTEFPVGSVSKIITLTAVLKLYSDGLININNPYTDYVNDFSMKSHFALKEPITIKHILSHTAGLPRLIGKGFLKKSPKPLEQILNDIKDEYLIAQPGIIYQYSDLGADLLALLVERVTGKNYDEYIKETIFKPLKMYNSYIGAPKITKGYIRRSERETYLHSYSGSDAVVSTATDLSKMIQLYNDNGEIGNTSFIKPDIIKASVTDQSSLAKYAFDQDMGLLWESRELPNGYHQIKKAGVHEPFYTYVYAIPEINLSAVICSNSNSSSAIHWDIWRKLFSDFTKKEGLSPEQVYKEKKWDLNKVQLSDNTYEKLEGNYNTVLGVLNLKRKGNKFRASLDNNKGVGVTYTDNIIKLYVKKFGLKFHALDIFWQENNDELLIGVQDVIGERRIIGSMINHNKRSSHWENAVGTYTVANYDENDYKTFSKVELYMDKTNLLRLKCYIDFPTRLEFEMGLSVISDQVARIPGYNFNFLGGESIKLEEVNGKPKIILSGYEFKKIE